MDIKCNKTDIKCYKCDKLIKDDNELIGRTFWCSADIKDVTLISIGKLYVDCPNWCPLTSNTKGGIIYESNH